MGRQPQTLEERGKAVLEKHGIWCGCHDCERLAVQIAHELRLAMRQIMEAERRRCARIAELRFREGVERIRATGGETRERIRAATAEADRIRELIENPTRQVEF